MSSSPSPKSRTIIVAVVAAVALAAGIFALTRGQRTGAAPAAGSSATKVGAKTTAPDGACLPTHCTSPECEACTAQNCNPATDGCDRLNDPRERNMCEDVYRCFNDPANKCVIEGDPLKCWCGTNPVTCVTSNEAPTQANGPCREKVFEGVASRDAPTVWKRFVEAAYPVAPAANLTLCRGNFCKAECKIP